MAETKFGTFSDLLALTPESLRPIVVELKNVITEIDPDAVEVVRLGDRAATYGVGPQKMKHGYTYILPHKSWVNLGFFRGGSLVDPTGLLEGTGKNMRHVKIRSLEAAANDDLKALIRLALEERRDALGG